MNFFRHFVQPAPEVKEEPTPKSEHTFLDIGMKPCIDGDKLIKLVDDNPEVAEGKTDVGIAVAEMWQPFNYNPETGEIL